MTVTPRLALIGTAAFVMLRSIGILLLSYLAQAESAIVNVTQFDGLTVLLDGKPCAHSHANSTQKESASDPQRETT